MVKKFEYTLDLELLEKIRIEFEDLKDRKANPAGEFDKKGRFYLDEKFDCCKGIRTPSKAFPYSEMLHGRTLIHVLYENGLTSDNLSEVRKYINSFKEPKKIEKHYCYKKVAIIDGNFQSLFDSSFIWRIGKKGKPKYDNFVYGFSTIEKCLDFETSKFTGFDNKDAKNFAILFCKTSKPIKEIEDGKFSYKFIKPIEWVLSQKEF